MSFPDLVLKPGGVLHSEVQGVPVNGDNEFDAGIDLVRLDEQLGGEDAVNEWLRIEIFSKGAEVTGATYVSRTGNKLKVNFAQGAADEALVVATVTHSGVR